MTRNTVVGFGIALSIAGVGTGLDAQRVAAPSAAQAERPFQVAEKSIFELQEAMRSGTITSAGLVEAYLVRIAAYDQAGPRINAFIALNPDARATAASLDQERRAGRVRGPLHGIPIVLKDNYVTADMATTAGSKALEGFKAGRDAFMVRKLRDAGAVVIGKTNLHELAYGITTISSMGGQTRNPYDPSRNPGGSSGGTGAAIAASFAAAGMGTDTCGSIRIPSADNNLFGLRGTRGLSSRDGIVPLAHSQDIGGPLARTVTDLIIMLDATVGFDAADPVTKEGDGHIPRSYMSSVGDSGLGDIRIGVLTSLFGAAPEDAEVGGIVREAALSLRQMGAEVTDFDIPGLDDLLQGTSTINAEFKYDLMDFLAGYKTAPMHTLAEILGSGRYDPAVETVLKRAEAVESRASDAYVATMAKRDKARQAVIAAMSQRGITALAYPTLRRKPAPIGQQQLGSNCQLSATTGLPAISMPAGFTQDRLPVGLELLGGSFSEPALLKIAYAYERSLQPRRKPITTP